jgi:hypothetical protein
VLVRLRSWNQNERAIYFAAGALLITTSAFARLPAWWVSGVGGFLLFLCGALARLPHRLRGAFALVAGALVLFHLLYPSWAAGSTVLLAGAFLVRAKDGSSRAGRLLALLGVVAVIASTLVVLFAGTVLSAAHEEGDATAIARALFFLLPLPVCVMGAVLALARRVAGGCVLWATLALLWAPVGLLVGGWWGGAWLPGLVSGGVVLAGSTAAALGLCDLALG